MDCSLVEGWIKRLERSDSKQGGFCVYLEDHPRTCKWLVSPLTSRVVLDPFLTWPIFLAHT